MKNYYGIGKAAEMLGVTTETLRHYDRSGVVKPCRQDKFTGYRYYSDDDIVVLRTVILLRFMNISLDEIKRLLADENLGNVVAHLEHAEKCAEEKIEELRAAIDKIRTARGVYEHLLVTQPAAARYELRRVALPERIMFVSSERAPADLSDLWQYHRIFYAEISESDREFFVFGETASVCFDGEGGRLCVECEKYKEGYPQLRLVKAGEYLAVRSSRGGEERAKEMLAREYEKLGATFPESYYADILITGILKWEYEYFVPLPYSMRP